NPIGRSDVPSDDIGSRWQSAEGHPGRRVHSLRDGHPDGEVDGISGIADVAVHVEWAALWGDLMFREPLVDPWNRFIGAAGGPELGESGADGHPDIGDGVSFLDSDVECHRRLPSRG